MIKTFWQKYQVLITGAFMSVIVAFQQFVNRATVDWKVVGFAGLIALGAWAGNNLRGKGVSVAGLIGAAGYAVSTTFINGKMDLNQLLLSFVIAAGSLVAPPPKSEAYEQSAIIQRAKAEAKVIDPSSPSAPAIPSTPKK